MRVISKKISYDSLTSKIPGIIPSIMDSWKIPQLYQNCINVNEAERFYSYTSAVKRASEYNINTSQLEYEAQFVQFDKNNLIEFTVGNYGLIPSDVMIPNEIASGITDYTDIYVNIPDSNGGFYNLSWPENDECPHYEGRKIISGGTEIKILTYSTLNKWYVFFKKYFELVKNPGNARIYENAIDYYNKEVIVKNEEKYNYYKSLDDIFKSRGGEEMYNWISDNCIVQYQIPSIYTDEWEKTFLYFADAIKWYKWFKEQSEYYKKLLYIGDCSNAELENGNCSDCMEFFRLGGYEFLKDIEKWVESVKINNSFATNSASVTIPISFTNSIDDLGEMAIFSDEWQGGVDYHNTLKDSGGTVVINYDDNETYIIKGSGTTGYYYNDFKENTFKSSDWDNYTDYYIKHNGKEFVNSAATENDRVGKIITGYTISPINGKIVYNPEEIIEKIEINKNNNVACINGVTYDIIDGKYVELCYNSSSFADIKYNKRTKLQIFKDGDIEYAVLNGKRKYVETDPNDPTKEKIYFLKDLNCKDDGCLVKEGKYIIFDNCLYLTDTFNITIKNDDSDYIYPILDGYFDIGNIRLYISGTSVVIQDDAEYNENNETYTYKFREIDTETLSLLGLKDIIVSDDKSHVTLYYIFEINNCSIITGRTDSKLDILRRKEITTDDLGNELPGYFKSVVNIDSGQNQSIYNVPYDECTLDILYKVGEVSDLKSLGSNKFIGSIITDVMFYYADENKVPIENTKVYANEDDALKAINKCKETYENLEGGIYPNIMYCDITYHLGATIIKNRNRYEIDMNAHTGVKYTDTVYVTRQVGLYYLNTDKYFTFNYYLLSQDIDTITVSDYNANITWDASTRFEMPILLYNKNGYYDNEKLFKEFDKNNSIIIAPLFRNEFNLASSLPQSIEADIYIDRGINAAFEKHLKLQEFRTMEALENYGNGWFKINEY